MYYMINEGILYVNISRTWIRFESTVMNPIHVLNSESFIQIPEEEVE